MKTIKSHSTFTYSEKFAAMISMALALTCGAYGQSEPAVSFDLELEEDLSKFKAAKAYFKAGAYHRGIKAHAVEFESLTLTTR